MCLSSLWVMTVCFSSLFGGCGSELRLEFPSEEVCYIALKDAKADPHVKSAFCSLKKEKKPAADKH